jgi:hypothetical protein
MDLNNAYGYDEQVMQPAAEEPQKFRFNITKDLHEENQKKLENDLAMHVR